MPAAARRELDLQRQEWISAPLRFVWEEMDSLRQVLAKTPYLSDHEVASGGERARARAHVSWGPVRRTVDVEVRMLGSAAERQIRYVLEALNLKTRVEVAIDLAVAGTNETRLHYRSLLETGHPTAVRMWHLLREVAEEQAASVPQRVKIKAEQRSLAHDRLLA